MESAINISEVKIVDVGQRNSSQLVVPLLGLILKVRRTRVEQPQVHKFLELASGLNFLLPTPYTLVAQLPPF